MMVCDALQKNVELTSAERVQRMRSDTKPHILLLVAGCSMNVTRAPCMVYGSRNDIVYEQPTVSIGAILVLRPLIMVNVHKRFMAKV